MDTSQKIAIDLKDASLNGAGKGRYAYELAHALIEAKPTADWILYIRSGKEAEFQQLKTPRVTIRPIHAPGPLWHFALKRALRRDRPDHFLAPTSYVTSALHSSVPTTLFVHDMVAFLFPKDHHRWAGWVERTTLSSALKNAANIVCVSECTERDLIKIFPQAKAKKRTIATPACVSTLLSKNLSSPANKKANSPDPFLLMVGTLEPRKNHRLIFQLFPKWAEQFPSLRLKLVGAKGWNDAKVMEHFPTHFKNRIDLCGRMSDAELADCYRNASALIFPSLYEGFGMPVLEAMSLGCPVVCSNRASLPEVAGTGALIRDPDEPDMWSTALSELLSSSELRKKLIAEGRLQAQKFSWQKSAQAVLKMLT